MTKALVTGADGFIGSHLVEQLLREGFEVRAMALYNSLGSAGWLERVPDALRGGLEVVLADVRDQELTAHHVAGCEVVFHLAALIGIPYSYVAPASYLETNIRGTLNVLEAVRRHDVGRLVVTSTSEVYGSAHHVPIGEDHPLVGQSPYAATKIAADQLALSFWRSFGTPVVIARPFNTYGPRQSTRAVIPTVITQIARGQTQLELGSLTPTRDFSFVQDTAEGFLAVARTDAVLGEVVNFGSGFEISVGDTVRLIAEVMGVEVEVLQDPSRVRPEGSEVDRLYADVTKAAALCGWQPRYSGREGFASGLAITCDWFSQPANLSAYRNGYTV